MRCCLLRSPLLRLWMLLPPLLPPLLLQIIPGVVKRGAGDSLGPSDASYLQGHEQGKDWLIRFMQVGGVGGLVGAWAGGLLGGLVGGMVGWWVNWWPGGLVGRLACGRPAQPALRLPAVHQAAALSSTASIRLLLCPTTHLLLLVLCCYAFAGCREHTRRV